MTSAFGIDHEEARRAGIISGLEGVSKARKKELTPAQRAGLAGGVLGATLVTRGGANKLGGFTGARVIRRGDWAMGRAGQMKSTGGAEVRRGYARRLQGAGHRIRRSDDTREIAGRATAALVVGGTTAGVSHTNRRMKENAL